MGCAIALPVAQAFHEAGAEVHAFVGFRCKDLVILEDEFNACSDKVFMMTDDGTYGRKGVVTVPLEEQMLPAEPPAEPLPLRECIDQLRPEWRITVLLYYLEGFSVAEIADTLGVPQGTVKTRLMKARARLSVLLREDWEEGEQ